MRMLDISSTWLPKVWNSVCLTASPELGTFRININGLTVWQTEDVISNLFQKEKVRIIIRSPDWSLGPVPDTKIALWD